jgi:hypothetical protein
LRSRGVAEWLYKIEILPEKKDGQPVLWALSVSRFISNVCHCQIFRVLLCGPQDI